MASFPTFATSKRAHLRFGERGERIAGKLLVSLGMEIVCCNYNGPHGEIDIVALDGRTLCFVEVKARKPRSTSRPADAVTIRKQWLIVRTAEHYLKQLDHPHIPWRYDIIEVVMTRSQLLDVRHWPGAFNSDVVRSTMAIRKRGEVPY